MSSAGEARPTAPCQISTLIILTAQAPPLNSGRTIRVDEGQSKESVWIAAHVNTKDDVPHSPPNRASWRARSAVAVDAIRDNIATASWNTFGQY